MDEVTDEVSGEQEKLRGRVMSAGEYLGHLVYGYCAAPADTPEESVAKALLELACDRLGLNPVDVTRDVMSTEEGGRVLPPWDPGTGLPEAAQTPPRLSLVPRAG